MAALHAAGLRAAPFTLAQSPEPSFLSGGALQRLGQNSAAEYWPHRSKNVCRIERNGTTFWVMHCQANDKEQPAEAQLDTSVASRRTALLFQSETEIQQSFKEAGVYSCREGGSNRFHVSVLGALCGDGRTPAE